MSVSQKEVIHIINLARIRLTHEEKERFEGELASILNFVEKLNEADVSNVTPMTGGTVQKNVVRDDERMNSALEGKAAELVGAIPEKKDKWAKVRAVFESHT